MRRLRTLKSTSGATRWRHVPLVGAQPLLARPRQFGARQSSPRERHRADFEAELARSDGIADVIRRACRRLRRLIGNIGGIFRFVVVLAFPSPSSGCMFAGFLVSLSTTVAPPSLAFTGGLRLPSLCVAVVSAMTFTLFSFFRLLLAVSFSLGTFTGCRRYCECVTVRTPSFAILKASRWQWSFLTTLPLNVSVTVCKRQAGGRKLHRGTLGRYSGLNPESAEFALSFFCVRRRAFFDASKLSHSLVALSGGLRGDVLRAPCSRGRAHGLLNNLAFFRPWSNFTDG